ncbi:MAG: hypothetical protein LBO06_08860 [Bacteroidales bacterium]|jgi:hypothetical protein|nr:hypothetical protein [Bacteroidales bacterium]
MNLIKVMMKKYLFLMCASAVLLLAACDDFDSEQEIPSYIRISGFHLVENTNLQYNQTDGFLSSNIVDVWVNVGNDTVRAFQLRDGDWLIPVLQKGKVKVTLQAGIMLNGIKATRVPYPFYSIYEKEVMLAEDSITDLGVIDIKYRDDWTRVPFDEQFEDSYFHFKTAGIDTTEHIFKISNMDSVKSGAFCGAMYMGATDAEYKIICKDSLHCTNTQALFLEIDYHCNIPFGVGIYGKIAGKDQYQYIPAMTLNANASTGWQKVYIVLGKVWSQLGNPADFWFYIQPSNPNKVSNGWVHIDNVKIVHYPN